MTIELFGIRWDLVIMTIYLVATFFTTEFLKKWIDLHPVIISWVVGAVLFIIIIVFEWYKIDFISVVQFVFLTLALNGSYKVYTKYLRRGLK